MRALAGEPDHLHPASCSVGMGGGPIYPSPSIPVHALSRLFLFSVHLVDARWKIQTFSCLAFKNPLRMQPDIYRRQCLWNNMKSLRFQYKGSDRLGICKGTSKLLLGVCNKWMKSWWCAPHTHHTSQSQVGHIFSCTNKSLINHIYSNVF